MGMHRPVTVEEAQAFVSRARSKTTDYDRPYAARMFDEIRQAAKAGQEKLFVDIIQYAYDFNESWSEAEYSKLLEALIVEAWDKGFNTRTICRNGEYVFIVSWAEN